MYFLKKNYIRVSIIWHNIVVEFKGNMNEWKKIIIIINAHKIKHQQNSRIFI
jgi:hypothetical protein